MNLFESLFPWFYYMLDLGGDLMLVIIILAAVIWAIIFERYFYINYFFPPHAQLASQLWQQRSEHRSWQAQQFRRYLVFHAGSQLERHIGLLKTLVKLAPLLGLLGTVVGMLEIFDAITITGGSNPRSTAGGVSKAIITTMAGMLVAIFCLPVIGYLQRRASEQKQQFLDRLRVDND